MKHYVILRLLLASFLLYFARGYIPESSSQLETVFWGVWLGFWLLVVGGNLASLLQLSRVRRMEQEVEEVHYLRGRQ